MGSLKNFVTSLHVLTKRDYLGRMIDSKPDCMEVAKQYSYDYWDGDRRFGYGGYKYIPGRWRSVAKGLIDTYDLRAGSTVLDVGCGKGYLLKEMLHLEPELDIRGIDISEYAIDNSDVDIRNRLSVGDARNKLPFKDNSFDLVISLGVIHNFSLKNVVGSITEIERVAKQSYIMVESYRGERELFNLQCWALTCESFFSQDDWIYVFEMCDYSGDYEFIFFE
jgi:SAM-dependent methyltransferase